MSIRRAVIEVDTDGLNVREFCRGHGISPWWFYDIRKRYAVEGEAALEPRSRAPHRVANKTSPGVEEAIVAKFKELENSGWGCGQESVWEALDSERFAGLPSPATVGRILTSRGFIKRDAKKAPKHTTRRFVAERANEVWQIDDTPFVLAGGRVVKIINVLDDCSRVLTASHATLSCDTEAALAAFSGGAGQWGWPERMLSDNGGAYRFGLADAVRGLGVTVGHSRPYHPQTCGKVERLHQTLKQWLAAQDQPADIAELQALIDDFADHYNHRRRHRGIDRRIPAEVWANTPKSGPATRPLHNSDVRFLTVGADGRISTKDHYVISIGVAYARKPAIVALTGTTCHVFVEGKLARQLTLDPTRRHQPLRSGPGRSPLL